MKQFKPASTILIRNPQAVSLVNELARQDHRSAANAAEMILISTLGKKRNPGSPAFLDNVILKGGEAGPSSEKPNEVG